MEASGTAIFTDLGLWEPGAAELALAVARGLAMRVSVSAYLGGVGLAPHSDNQCTVVLQLKGRKRWRLWLRQSAMLPTSSGLLVGRSKVRNPSASAKPAP